MHLCNSQCTSSLQHQCDATQTKCTFPCTHAATEPAGNSPVCILRDKISKTLWCDLHCQSARQKRKKQKNHTRAAFSPMCPFQLTRTHVPIKSHNEFFICTKLSPSARRIFPLAWKIWQEHNAAMAALIIIDQSAISLPGK